MEKKVRGFSLIEILIVVVLISIIIVWVGNRLLSGNSIEAARGDGYWAVSSEITASWKALTRKAGVAPLAQPGIGGVQSNPVLLNSGVSGEEILATLVTGPSRLAPAYRPAWDSAGLTPTNSITLNPNGYYYLEKKIFQFWVTPFGGRTALFSHVACASDASIIAIYNKYEAPLAAVTAAGEGIGNTIRYYINPGCGADEHNLLIIRY